MEITHLRTEYKVNPIGIDAAAPRLSWWVESTVSGARQTAYQILAASKEQALAAGQADLWDSGRVDSDQTVLVPYGGRRLASGERVWWKVRSWDQDGEATGYGEPQFFEMGLLSASDWQGKWLGGIAEGGMRTSTPCPYLRHSFTLSKSVASARLYASALGLYEFYVNGQKVGDDLLTPGWTDYRRRVQYQAYDVTEMLRSGANAAGAILGDGWYCGHMEASGRQHWGDRAMLLAQVEITYADGSKETIATGPDWKTATGPILESDIFMGEAYDARQELGDWSSPGYDDTSWYAVRTFENVRANLVAAPGLPVRRQEELVPVAEPKPFQGWDKTRLVYDLGQNMVGWGRLAVRGPAGTTLTLRFSEILQPDGQPYYTNLRSARATDYFTLAGKGVEKFEPRFTFHGFRYVEIIGLSDRVKIESLTGIVIHSEMERTGEFSCSDPLINQLQHNIQWGQKGNFVDVPTDCPQRDERQGWTGDAQVFIRTAAYNRQVGGFFTKWLRDLEDAQDAAGNFPMIAPLSWIPYEQRDAQGKIAPGNLGHDGGPAWADAGVICPWVIYDCYSDKQALAEHYDAMRQYVDMLVETSQDYIRCYEGSGRHCFGDWLALDGSGRTEGGTRYDLIGTAFMAHSADLLSRAASALGRDGDAGKYREVFHKARAAFQNRFVTNDGLVVGGTQTSYVLALHFNLMPEALREKAAAELVRDIRSRGNHLSTGFVGASYLPHVLTATGHIDVAYELLLQKSWPSYLYPVMQGATTIWERWDGWTAEKGFQDPSMNSFNHYAYGAIGDWLYRVVAGIDQQSAGYGKILLQPRPGGGLTSAGAQLDSVHGPIASRWEILPAAPPEAGRETVGRMVWTVCVPANTAAMAVAPARRIADVSLNGAPLDKAQVREGEGVEAALGAGEYEFTITDPIIAGR